MKQIRVRRKTRRPFRCLWVCLVACVISSLMATPALAAPPTNDELATATVIQRLPFSERIDATNATASEDDPTSDGSSSDYPVCQEGGTVWYTFTPKNDVRLVADTSGSDYDTVLAAFAGAPDEDTLVECNDNWRGAQSRVSFEAKSGQLYHFMVSGDSPGVLQFNLRAATPPPNDEMGRAGRIGIGLPFKDRVDTTDATLNVNDPSCSGRARSVWYQYTRPDGWDARRIELTTRGSDYYATLSVYTGPRSALDQLECDSGSPARVRFLTEPGTTYWIMVAAANNSQAGMLTLRAKNMPIPFKMRFGIAETGRISSVTSAVHVGGNLACNKKARLDIQLQMVQKQPEGKVRSDGVTKTVTCDKKGRWSIGFPPRDKTFTEGPAGVWVSVRVHQRDRERKERRVIDLRTCGRCL